MSETRYTYVPSEGGTNIANEDGWDYPALDDDDAVDRFIEEQRILFRKEWFRHAEENSENG